MASILTQIADKFLRMPYLKGISEEGFDVPKTTEIQRTLFENKKILSILYKEYCRPVLDSARRAPKGARMLEIGTGISPLQTSLPNLICSDTVFMPWANLTCSAHSLPFPNGSLDRIFLLFVFHHISRVRDFLDEARRCLKPGGEIVIVDPAITRFSKLYYKYLHMDKLDLDTREWGFNGQGRLSDSNIALAWMVFFRDKELFDPLYPEFRVEKVEYSTCLSFLISGGMRIRQLLPTAVLKGLFLVENWLIRKFTIQLAVTMALTIKRI